jgi:hypothetical protein
MPVPTLGVGAAQIIAPLSTMLFSTTYESEKASCGTRRSIPGTTRLKSKQHNTYETKLLILKAHPSATKTLRIAGDEDEERWKKARAQQNRASLGGH